MRDIQNRSDIELLVDEFYKLAIKDNLIGEFFTEVVKLNWDVHIPIMYDFWETTLLGSVKYKGNPMVKHIELSNKKALNPNHFDRWLSLWEKTIHENFTEPKSEEGIKKAQSISALMQYKIDRQSKGN